MHYSEEVPFCLLNNYLPTMLLIDSRVLLLLSHKLINVYSALIPIFDMLSVIP